MAIRVPALRVDHLSVAVHSIERALERWTRLLPVRMRVEPREGYDDQFRWTDFYVGDWKLELIESARPGSFVERFLARFGEGPHHLSLEIEEGTLDAYTRALEAAGLRIVDRGNYGDGDATAFISPRTAPGLLIQFWQVPGFRGARPPDVPDDPTATRDGVRFRVDHLAFAVPALPPALAWFERIFPVAVSRPTSRGWDGTHDLLHFHLADYKIELLAPAAGSADGFVSRFLARRGQGVHHIAVDVDRLAALEAQLAADGIRLVGHAEIAGGRRTAFVHPRDAHGTLVQFWEEPEFGGPRRP
jgi:methylmalonyl-CoA/ethylmalonyl-CoA epimerase